MIKYNISIIVPVYNVDTFVEDCIRSVMRQTYEGPMECIVVDDCGTDDSMVKVEKLISEYTGPITFKILNHTHNRGLSAARNTGMEAAGGDYLFFLDSDDEITDDCIEKLTIPLSESNYDIVLGDLKRIRFSELNGWEEIRTSYKLLLDDKTILTNQDILKTHKKGWNQLAQNKLYRVSFIKENNLRFKEGLLHEDNLWGYQVACLAKSLFVVKQVTYLWKERMGSITNLHGGIEYVQAMIVILREINLFNKEYHINNNAVFPVINYFLNDVLRYYLNSFSNYKRLYKDLRPSFEINIFSLIRKNHFNMKKYVHDLHYLMPLSIAPYWKFSLDNLILFFHKKTRKCVKIMLW